MPWETSPPSPKAEEKTLEEYISEWSKAQVALGQWKLYEMQLRQYLVSACFDAAKDSGTLHKELGGGWKLTCTKSLDYKLDSAGVGEVLNHFTPELANMLVSWKADLSVSNYKKLTPEQQALFQDCLTTKPSSPSLKLVPPKDAGDHDNL